MPITARRIRRIPYPDEGITRFINPWDPELETSIGIAPRLTVEPRTVEPEVIGVGPAPPLALGRNRPHRIPTMPGEEVEAERQYQQAVEGFEPRERGWKSRLGFAALSALQGLSGGIPGAIGAGLTGLGIAAFDPKVADRMWKQREAANSQERLTGLMAQRRGALQDELLRAQVEDERASAQQRLTPKAVVPEEYTLGPDQIRYRGGEVVARGPEREVPVKPRIKVEVPGYGEIEVAPESALNYFGQVANRENTAAGAELTNSQVQRNITEAQVERDRIGASLKDVPPTVTMPGHYEGDPPSVQPNPAYSDLMSRYRALDDDIRRWRTQLKPTATRGAGREDPNVRRYANEFFRGNYAAAQEAIRRQRGQ